MVITTGQANKIKRTILRSIPYAHGIHVKDVQTNSTIHTMVMTCQKSNATSVEYITIAAQKIQTMMFRNKTCLPSNTGMNIYYGLNVSLRYNLSRFTIRIT